MSVARVAASAAQQYGAVSSVTFAFAPGSGATKLVVDVAMYGYPTNPSSVTSITFNGVAATGQTAKYMRYSGSKRMGLQSFYWDNPGTASANVVVTFDINTYGTTGAVSYSGTASGIGAETEAEGLGTTASVTEADSLASSIVHAAVVCAFNGILTANQTENWTGPADPTKWKGGSEYTAGGGSKTMTWGVAGVGSDWIAVCFEVSASASASAAGGTGPMMGV